MKATELIEKLQEALKLFPLCDVVIKYSNEYDDIEIKDVDINQAEVRLMVNESLYELGYRQGHDDGYDEGREDADYRNEK